MDYKYKGPSVAEQTREFYDFINKGARKLGVLAGVGALLFGSAIYQGKVNAEVNAAKGLENRVVETQPTEVNSVDSLDQVDFLRPNIGFEDGSLFYHAPQRREKSEVSATNPRPEPKRYESKIVTSKFIGYITKNESHGDSNAVSDKGATGVMQVMPATWEMVSKRLYGEALPFSDAKDPEKNRIIGTNYLGEIENYYEKKLRGWKDYSDRDKQDLIAAGYNGGPGRIVKYQSKEGPIKTSKELISKMPKETRDYVFVKLKKARASKS